MDENLPFDFGWTGRYRGLPVVILVVIEELIVTPFSIVQDLITKEVLD